MTFQDPFEILQAQAPEKRGGDFFDYVLGSAREPISDLFGVMDPFAILQAQAPTVQNPTNFQRNALALEGVRASGMPKPGVYGSPGVSGSVGQASTQSTKIAQKIVQTATRLGLDPNFALWVAENEGGLDDAAANRRNRQGSQAYGPYQLLINGGLGDEALKQGIDPRDPNSWERQIEFALNHVARNGWGAWEAVTARGIPTQTGTPRGGYAAPTVPAAPLPASSQSLPGGMGSGVGGVTLDQLPQGQAATLDRFPQPAPGTDPYRQYATTAPSEYGIAFDFDQAYSNPFNPSIPRHRGVDLTVKGAPQGGRGSRVGAFHGGAVMHVLSDPNGGNGVILRDDQGLYHYYGHFDSIVAREGQRVERGTPLGILGASGTEGFPHLHYEVRRGLNGDPMGSLIDPRPYLNGAR